MGYRIPDAPALWQLFSSLLFAAGALGTLFIEVKIHKIVVQREGPAPGRKDLRALTLVCLFCTLLIATAALLPIAIDLPEPGGANASRRGGAWLLAAWMSNGAYCAWATLRFSRDIDDDRLRYAAAFAITLTNIAAGLHNYFWLFAPGVLPRLIGPLSAVAILASLAFACLLPAHALAAAPADDGPLFNWERIRVRSFGWIILLLNGTVFMLWHVRALPLIDRFLPQGLNFALPFLLNVALVLPYLYLKDSTRASRRMTSVMLILLATQLLVFAAVAKFIPQRKRQTLPQTMPVSRLAARQTAEHRPCDNRFTGRLPSSLLPSRSFIRSLRLPPRPASSAAHHDPR